MNFPLYKFIFLIFCINLFSFNFHSVFCEEPTKKIKIVSLSPNLTSIIIYLGHEDDLAGITRFCKISKGKKMEIVGDYLSPNLEKIISIKPDYVFLLKTQTKEENDLKKFKIKTVLNGNNTISEIEESVKIIGKILNEEEKADKLIEKIESTKAKYVIPEKSKPGVIFIVGKQPDNLSQLYAAAKGSFIDEIISAAGGVNLIEESLNHYPIISKEILLKLNPDIIIDSTVSENITEKEKEEQLKIWKQLSSLKAVKENKIIFLNDPDITIPGANIPESIDKINKLLHQ